MSTYTPEQVAALESQGAWTYDQAVEFAESEGLKVRSVISKIKHLKLDYTPKPTRVSKTGAPVVRKEEIVAQIQAAIGVSVPSLAKATKADLELLASALAPKS